MGLPSSLSASIRECCELESKYSKKGKGHQVSVAKVKPVQLTVIWRAQYLGAVSISKNMLPHGWSGEGGGTELLALVPIP